MSIGKFRQAIGPQGERTHSLDNQQRQFDRISSCPLLDGVQLSAVSLTTGQDNYVSHGLGRAYRGRIVTDQSADARIWTSSTTNSSTTAQIILKCSANVTASLWVY